MGGLLIASGFLGSILSCIYVDKRKIYKKTIIFFGFLGLITLVIFSYTLESNYILSIIMITVAGFFVIPIMPLCLELAAEVTYPIGEAFSSGALMTSGQFVGIIMILVLG